MGGCLDFRTASAANSLNPFQLTTHTLDLDVKVAFPTGGVLAGPHTLLLPLHSDLSPFHLLMRAIRRVICNAYNAYDSSFKSSYQRWKGERSRWNGRRRACGLARTPPVGKATLTSKSSVFVVSWNGSKWAAGAVLKSRELPNVATNPCLFLCYKIDCSVEKLLPPNLSSQSEISTSVCN